MDGVDNWADTGREMIGADLARELGGPRTYWDGGGIWEYHGRWGRS